MSNETIIRAWKDEEFLKSLSQAEREQMLQNPAGLMELADEMLLEVAAAVAAPGDPSSCKKKSCSNRKCD